MMNKQEPWSARISRPSWMSENLSEREDDKENERLELEH